MGYNILMRIAILGAGFTGLTAALRLSQKGHRVILMEKEADVGGLASGFKIPGWEWSLEKSYHHWFTNDISALKLAKELNQEVITARPRTDILIGNTIKTLDSPFSLLTFSPLPLADRLRTGFTLLYLKLLPNYRKLEGKSALPWIRQLMGNRSTRLIWEPLFTGKFGGFKEEIALTWFWARIKKRTSSLAYPAGGFQNFAQKLASEIKKLGGEILLKTEIKLIQSTPSGLALQTPNVTPPMCDKFDKIIVTLPTSVFTQITPNLPKGYTQKLLSIPHLHALNLILVLKKPFLKNAYWLNITDQSFPFLVLAEHTNFMDPKFYGGQHILYIGNYLPDGHPFLKMSADELLKIFEPYLFQIDPNWKLKIVNCKLFFFPFAQPVVTTSYPKFILKFQTPLKNVFLANLDMVYPWDRGTNYAIELGEKMAEIVNEKN